MTNPTFSTANLAALVQQINSRKYVGVQFHLDLDNPDMFYDITIYTVPANKRAEQGVSYKEPDAAASDRQNFERFISDTGDSACCFFVYDFEFANVPGKLKAGLIMISYVPNQASVKSRGVYGFNSFRIKNALNVGKIINFHERSELNYEGVITKLSMF